MNKASWFVWHWKNKSSICRSKYNFDNIIVSQCWIDSNFYGGRISGIDDGKVVAGPFEKLTDAIEKCDKLNENVV